MTALHDTISNERHDLQDDPLAGVVVKGLTQHGVDDLRSIMQHLHEGNRRRQTASHNMNQTSSRSHAVFQVCMAPGTRGPRGRGGKRLGWMGGGACRGL